MKFKNLALLLFTISTIGCSLDLPGIPIWTVQGTIPLNERIYRMSDLISDTAKFGNDGWGILVDEDSLLHFQYSDSLQHQEIGDQLTFNASEDESFSSRIGIINIREPLPRTSETELNRINPDIVGQQGPIPAFYFGNLSNTVHFNVFKWVSVNDGNLSIQVQNNLPFPVDTLIITIWNGFSNSFIGRAEFNERILPGEQAETILNMSGKYIENELELEIQGYSPGRDGGGLINGTEKLTIITEISETEVDSAEAEIEEQQFTTTDVLQINDNNKIVDALVNDGNLYLDLANTTSLRLNVRIELRNFSDQSGSMLIRELVLEPLDDPEVEVISLNGYTLTLAVDQQEVAIRTICTTEDTRETMFRGSSTQAIRSDQGIEVNYSTDEFILDHFHGILDSVRVEIPEIVTELNVPHDVRNVYFNNAFFIFDLHNDIPTPIELSLELVAINIANGDTVVLPVKGSRIEQGNTVLTIPDTVGFVSIFPDKIIVNGYAGLGKYYFPDLQSTLVTIEREHSIDGMFQLKSGLQLVMDSTKLESDLTRLSDPLDYPIENVELNVRMRNSLPLSGMIQLLMGEDTLDLKTLATIPVPRGQIFNHRSITPVDTQIVVILAEEQIAIMRQDTTLYTRQRMIFNSTAGEEIWLFAEDALTVQASATIFYTVDVEGKDEE